MSILHKTKVFVFISLLSFGWLTGCGKSLPMTPTSPTPASSAQNKPLFIQTANGKFLSLQCLQKEGLTVSAKSDCMEQSNAGQSKYAYVNGAYIYYPPNYTESNFCSYLGFSYPCYSYFGYSAGVSSLSLNLNYTYTTGSGYSTWNSCDSCLYNPYQYACLYGSSWSCVTPYSGTSTVTGYSSSTVTVACVGGPTQPSYAFWDFGSANLCAQNIASYSGSCTSNVRVGYCQTNSYMVGTTSASYCACNPGTSIGTW